MQKKKGSFIARNVVLYGVGGVLSQTAGLITLPLMVRKLTSAEYGAIDVITAATGYFALLIGLNTLSGLYRFFYESDDDAQEQKKLVSTAIIFVFLCSAAVAVISFLLSPSFSLRLFNSLAYTEFIQLAFLALIPVAIYNYTMGLLRIQNKALAFNIISLIVSAFYMGSIILFVGILEIGIKGYYYSQIIANFVGSAIALWLSRRLLIAEFSMFWFKKLARYSFPLVPGSLFAWSLSANNRLILNATTDQIQVAYYALANKAAVVITLATQAFCNAWEPTMYELLKQEEKIKQKLPTILSLYIFGTLSICILMMTAAKEIFLILAPPEYLAGIGLLGIIQLRWIFTMGVYVIDPGTAKTGRTYWVTIMLGLAVLINLLANVILTPRIGLYGAVLSELIGYAAAMIGRWVVSNRLFPVRWNYRYFVLALGLYGIVAAIQTRIVLSDMNNLPSFLLRLALGILLILVLWFRLDQESRNTVIGLAEPVLMKVRTKRNRK